MFNFTTNTYEMKREILNFTKKMSINLDKPSSKFISDMIFGIEKSQSILFSNIARELSEDTKLKHTIERLCLNCNNFNENNLNILENNYFNEIQKLLPNDEIILIEDDSDINKEYSKKLEDLCTVRDASKQKETFVNGYHVCEIASLTKNEKQPVSLYSKIYSTVSEDFISCNNETMKAEDVVLNRLRNNNAKKIFIKDRGYDIFELFLKNLKDNVSFIVRLEGNRNMLFKGKPRLVKEVAKTRKGKVHTKLMYKGENVDCYISYTTVQFPKYKEKDLTLIIIYRVGEEDNPMYLLTDMKVKNKDEVIKYSKMYMLRWRIEEYFRAKKQNYDFENFRIRGLKGINVLNKILTCVMLHNGILAEKINKKLLVIKIIEASKSLKNNLLVWYGQISSGIKEILKYAHTGIKGWQNIEEREKYKQLKLLL